MSRLLTDTSHIVTVAKRFLSCVGAESRVTEAGVERSCVPAGGVISTQACVQLTLVDILTEGTESRLRKSQK